jgi:Uma2 family endonuclease
MAAVIEVVAEAANEVAAEAELDPEKKYEIVNGQPEEKEMPGARHSGVETRLSAKLWNFADSNNLGGVYCESSFQIGDKERIPDIAFISIDRIPAEGEPETKWPFAPDLAVEVISPNDLFDKLIAKTKEYFAAGVKQVWWVAPEHKIVMIYRPPLQLTMLSEEDELASEDLLPGFRCRVSELFRNPAKKS